MSARSPHRHRILLAAAAATTATLMAVTLPASAFAATSASGSQSVTADIANTLEATFPGAYPWGALSPGAATSSAQTVNVKSNASWGLKASTDAADGVMKEWNAGTGYVAVTPKVLANALTWKLGTLGGAPQGGGYAAFTSTPALVTGTQGVTGDSGVDVGLLYQQTVSYADANAGSNDYRILVSFDVAQGY